MFIKEIELNNFRIYKGKNKINLLPSNDKNIIVISGKNGFGKTTFLMSLVWCLYGKQMHKVDDLYNKEIDEKGGYGKYIGLSLNRLAGVEGETKFSISIVFTKVKIPDITCNEIKITREFDTRTSQSDRVEILIDGTSNELIRDLSRDNQSGEEIFIRDFILPLEIAKFFFFDAEKIVSLAEVSTTEQRLALSKAYSEVLGIHKYEELREHIENLQDDYRKKSAKPQERKEFIDVEANIKSKELEISELEHNIETLNEEKSDKKYDSNQIQETLIRDKDCMSIEQLEKLRIDEVNINNELIQLQHNLKDVYDYIPFALSGEVLLSVLNQVENELKQRNNIFKKDEVDRKIYEVLQDLEKEKINIGIICDKKTVEFYDEQFKLLIKKHFYGDIQEFVSDFNSLHDFSESQKNQLNQLISQINLSFKEKFQKIYNDYVQNKNKLASIRRKLREAERNAENPYINDLRNKKESLEIRISQIDLVIRDDDQKIGSFKSEIKKLKQKQAELRKKIDVSEQNKLKDSKLEEISKVIKKFIINFKEEKKRSLEINMKEKLSILMHKKDFIDKVEVDILGENIDINLKNIRNEKIDKSSLSMGERQMYASALLNSLVNESDIDFPVFIDSPMQKFDKEHAENIIKNFYPNVSKQVVIFPLIHKELTESEYKILKINVSRSYIIDNINHDSSKFNNIDPENLIKEYNKLYDTAN